MGLSYDSIPDKLVEWALTQRLFWVATAPLAEDGHVNLSPKGVKGTLHIVDGNQCWYEDLTGSGVETISHLRENGRITILFQEFEGAPRILRFYGRGTVHEFGTPEYDRLLPIDKRHISSRAAIVIDIHKVTTACGWGVPKMAFLEERTNTWDVFSKFEACDREQAAAGKPPTEDPPNGQFSLKYFWRNYNLRSLDALPGLEVAATSEKLPETTLHHRFRKDAELEAAAQKTAVGFVRRESKFIVGMLVGLMLAVGYVQAVKLVEGLSV